MARYFYVWWVDQSACECIGERLPTSFDKWVRDQYQSRYGRAGRGRLWCDDEVMAVWQPKMKITIKPWPKTKLAKWLGGDFGGIVLTPDQAEKVIELGLPGVMTNNKMKLVSRIS